MIIRVTVLVPMSTFLWFPMTKFANFSIILLSFASSEPNFALYGRMFMITGRSVTEKNQAAPIPMAVILPKCQ